MVLVLRALQAGLVSENLTCLLQLLRTHSILSELLFSCRYNFLNTYAFVCCKIVTHGELKP